MTEITLKSHRFRAEREESWRRLEAMLATIEAHGMKGLGDDEIIELPNLYRSTLSSLSVARATSLDQNVIAYLQALSTRAYYALYGSQVSLFKRMSLFFARDWPAAAKALSKETLVAGFITLLGAFVAFMLVRSNPEWYFTFISEGFAGVRNPASSTEALRETLYSNTGEEGLSSFATMLFSHNSRVAIFAFALGFAFGIPTAVLLLYNGCILGAFVALFVSRGLGYEVGGWLIIHGATEIFAIILAGAAGLHIGKSFAFPGEHSRLDSASQAGQRAGTLMAGVVIMLFIAGLLEGFGRQLINVDWLRYLIGITTFILWCTYFYAPRTDYEGENYEGVGQ